MSERPRSVVLAVQVIWLLVALATAAVVAVLVDHSLVDDWVGGARRSADDTRVPPTFTPVLVVIYVVIVSLILVLTAFVRGGHNWARHCMGGAVVLVAVATVAALRTDPPSVFVVFAGLTLALEVVLLVALYLPGTTEHVMRPWRRDREDGRV